MEITRQEVLYEGKYLRMVNRYFKTDIGEEIAWETVERRNIYGKGAVVVVALTVGKELILERNWRAPLGSFIIQFPAGLCDKEGEGEEEAARRELLEETGYRAERLIPIISAPLCPALTSTRATHFFAPKAKFIGEESRDATEEIEVLKVPVEKLDDFLLNIPEDTELDLRVPGILWVLQKKGLL
jgi:ADP-ribose pyrophosphatase